MLTLLSRVGRSKIEIDIQDIEFLRNLRFTWTKIAELLRLSRSTLYRRLKEGGLSSATSFTIISNQELDIIIRDIKVQHPHDGERLMAGHLLRLGILVPRAKMQAFIHRVDPISTALRRSITIRRR